jgi:hypothetical protein
VVVAIAESIYITMWILPRAEVRRTSWCAKPLDKAAGSLQGFLLPVPGDNKINAKKTASKMLFVFLPISTKVMSVRP